MWGATYAADVARKYTIVTFRVLGRSFIRSLRFKVPLSR